MRGYFSAPGADSTKEAIKFSLNEEEAADEAEPIFEFGLKTAEPEFSLAEPVNEVKQPEQVKAPEVQANNPMKIKQTNLLKNN